MTEELLREREVIYPYLESDNSYMEILEEIHKT